MCSECERKDRVIDRLKDSVLSKTKQARLETVKAIFANVRYPTAEHKQKVIQSLANSEVELDLIRGIANDVKRTTGIHTHYS